MQIYVEGLVDDAFAYGLVGLAWLVSELVVLAGDRPNSVMAQGITAHWCCRSCTRPCAVAKVNYLR